MAEPPRVKIRIVPGGFVKSIGFPIQLGNKDKAQKNISFLFSA
jgi:hypothetical protein